MFNRLRAKCPRRPKAASRFRVFLLATPTSLPANEVNYIPEIAKVAELADAPDLGSGG